MLEADYVVIGGGALSLAFVDELIHKSQDVTAIIVEKRGKPGGHWNDAYDFVRLHQPAAWYGVSSEKLGIGGPDLVSKSQILAYYELVVEKLISTKRVKFFWQCEYREEGKVVSLVEDGLEYQIKFTRKIVDGTRMAASVPSMRPPSYGVKEGVNIIPINGLINLKTPYKKYVVVGAGKTGLDALLYLLERNVSPDRITWIVPNDCWYLNRDIFKMDDLWSEMEKQFKAALEAKDIDDVYLKYEELGIMMRVDKTYWPTRMRGATITIEELEKVRSITNIIRHGRIKEISSDSILFMNGTSLPADSESLYVDCAAKGCGLGAHVPAVDVFSGNRINLQMFLLPQPCGSSGIIAMLELRCPDDDALKNDLCRPHDAPNFPWDWFKYLCISETNLNKLRQSTVLGDWIKSNRLSIISHLSKDQLEKMSAFKDANQEALNANLRLFGEQKEIYGNSQKSCKKPAAGG